MITSVANPMVKDARTLKDGRIRRALSLFLAEGPHMAEEALKSGASILRCFYDPSRAPKTLMRRMEDARVETVEVAEHVLDALSNAASPRGVVTIIRITDLPLPMHGRFLALDGLQDPGNVGTMLRSVEAAGFSGMILGTGCADVFSPKAAQATMGSLFRVPIKNVPCLAETLTTYREASFALYAANMDGESIYNIGVMPADCVLTVGAEGKGVGADIMSLSQPVALPMKGATESLNAAVAASVLMYEMSIGHEYKKGTMV